VANPQKRKGDDAEREIAAKLTNELGFHVQRKLGAGRKEDTGDLYGIPDTVVQVASWADVSRAALTKSKDAEQQRINAAATFAATAVRFPRGEWRIVMTVDQFATYVRNSLPCPACTTVPAPSRYQNK